MMQLMMRIIQRLLLILFITGLPAIASAQRVSATMQVSMNVIQTCSVRTGDDFSDDEDMNDDNIRCGSYNVHRISQHREHAHHQRHVEYDQDDILLTTVEF